MELRKILLDTNAYSALMNSDEKVKKIIENTGQIFMPAFVIAELLYGFKKGTKEKENKLLLESFLQLPGVAVLNTSLETPQIFATLLLSLKQKGKPIPTHDIWIAALSIESGSVIITYDKHFTYMGQVRVW